MFCNVQNITVDSDMPIDLQYTTAGSVLWLFPESIVLDTGKLGDEVEKIVFSNFFDRFYLGLEKCYRLLEGNKKLQL